MHPVVRVVSYLILAAALSLGGVHTLALGAGLLVVAFAGMKDPALGRLGVLLARLRMLWLSLVIAYGWFTPGTPALALLGQWSPTWEGLHLGAWRGGVLALLVAGAHWLFQTCSREELVGAIHWLAAPLDRLGASRDRFAVRLVLVLETVPALQERPAPPPAAHAGRGRVQCIASRVADRLDAALEGARNSELRTLELPRVCAPGWQQWSVPVLLAAALWLVSG